MRFTLAKGLTITLAALAYAVALAADNPQATIRRDATVDPDTGRFTEPADFGDVAPGDVLELTIKIKSPCKILSGMAAGGGWTGGGTKFTVTIPDNFAGRHTGKFNGTYGCGGNDKYPPEWSGEAVANVVTGWEWEPFRAMTTTAFPLTPGESACDSLTVGLGQMATLQARITEDHDRRRKIGTDDWMVVQKPGPYRIVFRCPVQAEFTAPGSGERERVIDGLDSGNVLVFFTKQADQWPADQVVTITAELMDLAPNPSAAPDQGTARDESVTRSWKFKRGASHRPGAVTQLTGAVDWEGRNFSYRGEPGEQPKPAGHRPWYECQVMGEKFSTPAARLFTMADVAINWQQAHPGILTPDDVALTVWGSDQANGTFVFNNEDEVFDEIITPASQATGVFTPAALASPEGVGYISTQTFEIDGNEIASMKVEF